MDDITKTNALADSLTIGGLTVPVDAVTSERLDQMVDYIMKYCLWQFNSRGWDRKKQNAGIIPRTAQLLTGEEVARETPSDRYYWVEAVTLAEAYRERMPWLADMTKEEIKTLLQRLHERIDYLVVDGSLNEELTVPHY
ncbi:Fe-only nitrogenase subunit delta [Blastochloris viridis]|uniref:Nitrogenase iron-iron protein delta chain n=1 Tax=Blastochloris viridis TaxID=1079 RepID=A0A0H5BGA4_BLAVI|nr:Fe-only nitrogenase subunit delta [Blastochloris viridis]ALK10658.1 Nitrogenase iron-iron protein delta chain [Blastochloris viridis]BAR99381.1 nitrogenase (iron-iron) delta chain [Blastochloris viridis]CUU43321.1 Nitrogenase iron-iron protein delta chain [Blastochloris viridis]